MQETRWFSAFFVGANVQTKVERGSLMGSHKGAYFNNVWTRNYLFDERFSCVGFTAEKNHNTVDCWVKQGRYLQVGMTSLSTSLAQRDHSIWTAVMGCTAWARRISDPDASDNPKYFTFPSSTSDFMAPTYTHKPIVQNSMQPSLYMLCHHRLDHLNLRGRDFQHG